MPLLKQIAAVASIVIGILLIFKGGSLGFQVAGAYFIIEGIYHL